MTNHKRYERVQRNPVHPPRGAGYSSGGGGGGGAWCAPYRSNGVTTPGCGRPVQPACDVQAVNFRQATIAAATATTFTVAPTRSDYFQGLAIRMTVVDNADPDTYRALEVHSIDINGSPQEPWSNTAVVTGNTSVLHSDVWSVPEGYGVPISWGIFAQANFTHILQLGVFTRYTSLNVAAYVTIFGNPMDTLPVGVEAGRPLYGVPL